MYYCRQYSYWPNALLIFGYFSFLQTLYLFSTFPHISLLTFLALQKQVPSFLLQKQYVNDAAY